MIDNTFEARQVFILRFEVRISHHWFLVLTQRTIITNSFIFQFTLRAKTNNFNQSEEPMSYVKPTSYITSMTT